MAMSKNLGMYNDVESVFKEILAANKTCTLSFPTKTKARQWKQRAYYYRKLLHDKQASQLGLEVSATSTPYDAFIFREHPTDPTKVRVETAYRPDNISFDEDATDSFGPISDATDLDAAEDAFAAAKRMLEDLGDLDL